MGTAHDGCHIVAPSSTPCSTESPDPLELHRRDDRAHVDRFVERRADAQLLHPRAQLGHQRSAMPSCTSSREPAQQTCPWLNQIASTTPSTTLSRSASSNTMNGLLPPSSSVSFLPEPAVALRMIAPDFRRAGERDLVDVGMIDDRRAGLAVAGHDVDHARRQSRASCTISANASAVSGVNSAGLSTIVFPAAIAGAIFHASMSSGKFHGMICPTTPIAS